MGDERDRAPRGCFLDVGGDRRDLLVDRERRKISRPVGASGKFTASTS